MVSLKISLLRTDCLHYNTTAPGCHTTSKKPMPVNSWFLSVLFLPRTFPRGLKMSTSSLHSCRRKHGLSFPQTSAAFQNQDPSTLGPMELMFLYMKLFYLSGLGLVEGKKVLGILFLPVLFVSVLTTTNPIEASCAFSHTPRFSSLAQQTSAQLVFIKLAPNVGR